MAKKLDSTTLFLAQICNHTEELAGLLALGTDQPIEESALERAVLSTAMLANSASLMELNALQTFLSRYEALLKTYRERKLAWDERIAQLTSEIIEKEDNLVTGAKGKAPSALRGLVRADEWGALANELAELESFAETAEPLPASDSGPAQVDQPRGVASEAPRGDSSELQVDVGSIAQDRELGKSIGDLVARVRGLVDQWESGKWSFESPEAEHFQELRKELFSINFHALSIEQIVGIKTGSQSAPAVDALAPIASAIRDFSEVLCVGTDRRLDVSIVGEDCFVDVRLLLPIVRVLQLMIGDVFLRCSGKELRIEVVVREQHGALIWSLSDNGDNFITDSPLDPDEYVAFYPGLRETCRILSELHSLLWVEPDENHETRFAFSVPLSPDGENFVVWQAEASDFAVPSNQVSDIFPVGEIEVKSDSYGEHVIHDGGRVALCRLDQVYQGGAGAGDRIVVVGCLEKRIAFYVNGGEKVRDGVWVRNAIPAWKGMDKGVAQIGEKKLPLVEANSLLARFFEIASEASLGGLAGSGEPGPHAIPSNRSLASKEDEPAPEAHVLVVERSEALRNTFASILSQKKLRAELVDRLDTALNCLRSFTPLLIISEFRVPSMAAKILVEKLRAEGKDIPVIVTTTHDGDNAQLLVDKLGAAGYITKPLDSEEVWTRIGGFLQNDRAGAKA